VKISVPVIACLLCTSPIYADEPAQTPAEVNAPIDQPATKPKPLGLHRCTRLSESWIRSTPRNSTAFVHINFHIAVDGTVKDIVVSSSSGNADLDALTVSCAQQWRYAPATQNDQPVETPWEANLRYWHG
jgi:TonB family protein